MTLLVAITVGLLFAIGIFQMLRRNIIRSVIGLMILANAVNLFLLSTGAYDGLDAAYTTADQVSSDPLPQALILTSSVIGLGVLALMLAISIRLYERYGTFDISKMRRLKG